MTHAKKRLTILGKQALIEYARLDTEIERVLEQQPVSCKRGCAACCKQLISISVDEAAAIAVAYPKKLMQRRRRIAKQAHWLETRMQGTFGSTDPFEIKSDEDMQLFSARNRTLAELWWEDEMSCVFLREDKTCAVYDARPIACRSYFVVSDPALCHAAVGTEVSALDIQAAHVTRLRIATRYGSPDLTISYMPQLLLPAALELEK